MASTWETLNELQPTVMKMLKNSIVKDRLAHAYLFEGMKGTGKKQTSIYLAKTIFCQKRIDQFIPCETCHHCKRIESGNHPDVHIIEPDGLSIKKAQIKMLQEEFFKSGVESKKKIYILNHADRMTTSAQNSLLKFLEEPNSETTAILITEQVQQILPTILSRCQILSFKPFTPQIFITKLIENGVDKETAPLIAQITNNVDEGLALSKDDWFAQAQNLVVKLYEMLNRSSLEALFSLQENWFEHFKEKEQMDLGLNLFLLLLKDLIYIQVGKEGQMVFLKFKSTLKAYALQTAASKLTNQMASILEAKKKLHANMNPQLLMEQLVLKLQEGSSDV